eukprot:6214632-Pleurochrysis_carterae.AAC.6
MKPSEGVTVVKIFRAAARQAAEVAQACTSRCARRQNSEILAISRRVRVCHMPCAGQHTLIWNPKQRASERLAATGEP